MTLLLFSLLHACDEPAEQPVPANDLSIPAGPEKQVIEETYSDGSQKVVVTYRGNYKASMEEFYESGIKMQEGRYNKNGEREGKWSYWYRTGKLNVECSYKNGLRHGPHTVYYENGFKRFEGKNRDDNRIGIWQFWDETGKLASKYDYDRGGIKVFP